MFISLCNKPSGSNTSLISSWSQDMLWIGIPGVTKKAFPRLKTQRRTTRHAKEDRKNCTGQWHIISPKELMWQQSVFIFDFPRMISQSTNWSIWSIQELLLKAIASEGHEQEQVKGRVWRYWLAAVQARLTSITYIHTSFLSYESRWSTSQEYCLLHCTGSHLPVLHVQVEDEVCYTARIPSPAVSSAVNDEFLQFRWLLVCRSWANKLFEGGANHWKRTLSPFPHLGWYHLANL